MRTRISAALLVLSAILASCAGRESPYVGEWRYDRQSLRPLALASAYDSVSDNGAEALSPQERAEVERWVNENHDGWDKRLFITADGSYLATSQIGSARLEEHTGTWSRDGDAIRLTESDGETMALAHLEGARLVLVLTDDEGTTARMVMLQGQPSGHRQDREQGD